MAALTHIQIHTILVSHASWEHRIQAPLLRLLPKRASGLLNSLSLPLTSHQSPSKEWNACRRKGYLSCSKHCSTTQAPKASLTPGNHFLAYGWLLQPLGQTGTSLTLAWIVCSSDACLWIAFPCTLEGMIQGLFHSPLQCSDSWL